MSNRLEISHRLRVDGQSLQVNLIANPTIDDIIITEMKVRAYEISVGETNADRRVSRDIRDFLIRLGVER